MPVKVQVTGQTVLTAQLKERINASAASPKAVVGFAAPYAIPVHERLDLYHPIGQAKFLEEPAKRFEPEIKRTIRAVTRATGSLAEGMLAGAKLLLMIAKAHTPYDTGALRSSGFAALEQDGSTMYRRALTRSNSMRRKKRRDKELHRRTKATAQRRWDKYGGV